jgi:hypothetical protein
MAARAQARSRSAALAVVLAVGFAACGHDTLRLLPTAEDESPTQDAGTLDSGMPPKDAAMDAGMPPDGGESFGGRNAGTTGTSDGPPNSTDSTATTGGEGGAPACEGEFCGACHPYDLDCWRCLAITSCEFRPGNECEDRWRAIGCDECDIGTPCTAEGEACHQQTHQCLATCAGNDDCQSAAARLCDEDGLCVECRGTSDCCAPGDLDCGRVCHLGKCFQCSSDNDCRPNDICVQGVCLQCVIDDPASARSSMCLPHEPYCSRGRCQECTESSHCYPGEVCDTQYGGICTNAF